MPLFRNGHDRQLGKPVGQPRHGHVSARFGEHPRAPSKLHFKTPPCLVCTRQMPLDEARAASTTELARLRAPAMRCLVALRRDPEKVRDASRYRGHSTHAAANVGSCGRKRPRDEPNQVTRFRLNLPTSDLAHAVPLRRSDPFAGHAWRSWLKLARNRMGTWETEAQQTCLSVSASSAWA